MTPGLSAPFYLTLTTPPGSWQETRTWQLIYHLWTRAQSLEDLPRK